MFSRAESVTPQRHLSVVFPIYQTGMYLRELYQRTCTILDRTALSFELLMIDDGSSDDAWQIVTELSSGDPRVKGIKLSRNFGQHPAICAGLEHAEGDIIVLMDADLQDRPEDLPLLLERLTGDIDIVYTVKRPSPEQAVLFTRLSSRVYHLVFSRVTGRKVPANVGTFRAFTRQVLEALLSYPERNVFYGPLMFHLGYNSTVVEVQHDPRSGSRSGYTFSKRLALALGSLVTYTNFPQKVLVWSGATLAAGCGLYAVLIAGKYLVTGESLPSGLTLLALLNTFSFGSILAGIGLIGTYVFRVYQEVLRRPRYLISHSVNVTSGARQRIES